MEDNILRCSYNIDSGYVEVIYKDSSVLKVKCEEVEERLNLNMVTESVLQKLLDENPVEYVVIVVENTFGCRTSSITTCWNQVA